jgi:dTDP-4-amino-4,6-dideoxygalactose transaminase
MNTRTKLLEYLDFNGINSVFHYVPLHSSSAGLRFGRFNGVDEYTTTFSEQLIRLPLWFGISIEEKKFVMDNIYKFFSVKDEK